MGERPSKHWIDRIDNNLGYIIGNIQWVHKDINNLKGTFNENLLLYYFNEDKVTTVTYTGQNVTQIPLSPIICLLHGDDPGESGQRSRRRLRSS